MFERGGRLPLFMRRALFILPFWVATSLWMWLWWLNSSRVGAESLYIPLTLAMFYEYAALPFIFIYFLFRAKKPRVKRANKGKKVAVITLCVPSQESLDIVERQLAAISAIEYPHDSWILDEGNSPEIKRLARHYGVLYFSRKGIKMYNQAIPPFKAKTKAGNVNAWLDKVKRRKYEYFVQLDIDHIPKPNYLHKTLGYFKDENIAWVQAPSVYSNLDSWTARGAAETELPFQGPLQMGFYGHSKTPFIIGSHCTYRMSAIREVGGFQPTRAEDHLDTVALASIGWEGVFLPEVIAEGDGPDTLNTYLSQHFAWAYSMFQVLIYHSPQLLRTMPLKKKAQFLFAQTWYPLWSLSYMIMFLTPIAALLTNQKVINSQGYSFAAHFLPLFICGFLVWWAARPLMQPQGLRLSWRGLILHATRWPIILRAVLSAAFGIKKPYMITPKGKFSRVQPSLKLYFPFLALGFISCAAISFASFFYGYQVSQSQILFALLNVWFALILCGVDLGIRIKQAINEITSARLNFFRTNMYKPVTAIMILFVAMTSAISSAVAKQGLGHAAAAPQSSIVKIDPLQIPAERLSDQQMLYQLSLPSINAKLPLPSFGICDPNNQISTNGSYYIRHSFVDWRDYRALEEQLLITKRDGAVPLITIEPRGQSDGQQLFIDIADGKYDQQLMNITKIIADYNGQVYIRFAHEMDLSDLYPWGQQDPALFISAYRHVVEYAKANGATNVKWVWSPAGNAEAAAYYPGDDVVDVVGSTLLYDQYWYGDRQLSFAELASIRQWLEGYGKPVWLVEFGVGTANSSYQQALITDTINNFHNLGFSALIYLNLKDQNIQGPDYSLNNKDELNAMFTPVIRPTLNYPISTTIHDKKQANQIKDNLTLNISPTTFKTNSHPQKSTINQIAPIHNVIIRPKVHYDKLSDLQPTNPSLSYKLEF